jgi:DNA gyrase subunit A
LIDLIKRLTEILNEKSIRMQIVIDEMNEVKEKFGDERRTSINYAGGDMRIEDIIPDAEVVITISNLGYVKRTLLSEYRTQSRGGVGSRGASARDSDFIEHVFVATNHNYLLFFTELGRCFWLRVFEIPEASRTSKGKAIVNLINIPSDDRVKTFINTKDLRNEDYVKDNYVVMCTKRGVIKKTSLEAYSRPRSNGINAITVRDGDTLLEARLTNGEHEVLMAIGSGKAIRFPEDKVRAMGRNAAGVKGMKFDLDQDFVVGMVCPESDQESILVVSENGYGKRTLVEDYRITNRGGKGVKTLNITEKTGDLIGLVRVNDDEDLMITTKNGIMIRMPVEGIRVMGRATQGVRVINLKKGEVIASIAKVPRSDEEDTTDMEGQVTDNGSDEETSPKES